MHRPIKTEEKVDLKMGPGKTKISSCLSMEDEKRKFILSLTQRHHVRNSGDGGFE